MDIAINLIGGLGLFLFGMGYMGDGLQKAAGSKMKDILAALTKNKLMGVLVGTLVTGVIQSSSATTVMVVGFVNAFKSSSWRYNGCKYWYYCNSLFSIA